MLLAPLGNKEPRTRKQYQTMGYNIIMIYYGYIILISNVSDMYSIYCTYTCTTGNPHSKINIPYKAVA